MTNWSNKTSLSKSAFDFALGVNEADWPDFQANPYSYEPTTFRLTSLVTTRDSDSKVLQDITYVYDPVGNIVKLTDGSHDCVFTNNQQVNAACGYTYDAMYRLTAAAGREHVALGQNADTDATAFLRSAWAHLNNSQQLVNYTENYVYDTAGNLTQIQHAGASTYTRYIDIATASNRGLQRPDQGQPDFANSFDENGNQVLMGQVDSLAWDYQDRLQKVVLVPREDDQDDAEWYVYDGAGQRVRKVRETVGYGGTTLTREEKIYLGDAEIKRVYLTTYDEYDVPTTTKVLDRTSVHVMDDKSRVALAHYWSVDTNLLELDNTNQLNTHRIRYQYGNHLGSASLELDAAGSVISYEEYLPYGGTSFVAGTSQTEVRLKEYRYSAKERDNSTGLYYYGARYYAPWLGRWVSTDPLGLKAGINDYAFVRGNPITRIDVDGRQEQPDVQQPSTEPSQIDWDNVPLIGISEQMDSCSEGQAQSVSFNQEEGIWKSSDWLDFYDRMYEADAARLLAQDPSIQSVSFTTQIRLQREKAFSVSLWDRHGEDIAGRARSLEQYRASTEHKKFAASLIPAPALQYFPQAEIVFGLAVAQLVIGYDYAKFSLESMMGSASAASTNKDPTSPTSFMQFEAGLEGLVEALRVNKNISNQLKLDVIYVTPIPGFSRPNWLINRLPRR